MLSLLILSARATLLIDYTPSLPISSLGTAQLEGSELGDHIPLPGNDSIYIRTGTDPAGTPALNFHRDATFRRAEVKGKGSYEEEKRYFVGYEFRLGNVHEALTIFQWKDGVNNKGASDYQDVPFSITFSEQDPPRLSLRYGGPGNGGQVLWTDDSDFAINQTHHIGIAWDTNPGGNNSIQLWANGESVVQQDGLNLWTGDVYPKWGIYRGEKGEHDLRGDSNVFNSWVYRVQLGDEGMDEVREASGVRGQGN